MNTIECPRCGHDHGPGWGDREANVGDGAARCHADAEQGRPGDRWCVCTLSLSSALAAVTRMEAVEDTAAALDAQNRSLERLVACLERLGDDMERLADGARR